MNNNFTDLVSQLLRDNYVSSLEFWNFVEIKNNSFYYSLKLFELLLNPKKREKYSLYLDRITSMLMVLEYFHNIDKKEAKLIAGSRELVLKIAPTLTYSSRWIFEMFMQNSNEKVFTSGFIRILADLPLPKMTEQPGDQSLIQNGQSDKNMMLILDKNKEQERHFQEHIKTMELYQQNTEAKCEYYECLKGVRTSEYKAECTFAYVCFNDFVYVKDLKLSESFYIDVLRVLEQLLKFSTKINMTKGITKMLHFLQSLIKFYVLPYKDQVKQLLVAMRQFRNFPHPISILAQQLVQMLYDELRGMGFTYRYNMRVTVPSLDVMGATNLEYSCYFISRSGEMVANSQFCSLQTLRKCLIINMIWKVGVPKSKQESLIQAVARLPPQVAYQYYCKLLRIYELCAEADNIDKNLKMQEKYILLLILEIEKEQLVEAKQVLLEFAELYRNKTYNFFEFPQCKITCLSIKEFVSNETRSNSLRMILNNRVDVYRLHQEKFRIVFRGSDREFRSIVQVIGETYQKKDGPASLIDLQLFILPEKREHSLIAAYIAANDCWYSQFVYNAFVRGHFYPEHRNMDSEELPGMLLSKTVQVYLREATRILSIRLFKCCLEFFGDRNSENIFFCRSVEMGVSALVNKYRQGKQKYQDLDYMDIVLDKLKTQDKTNQELTVIMDVQVCDMFGVDIETVSFQETRMADLRICNVPIEYFMGKQPVPSSDTLQFSILRSQNAKEFERLLQQKTLFKKSKEQVMFQFKSLFNYESIKGIFVQSNNNKGMNVSIDGELFLNVKSIKIDPLDKSLKQNRLPIKTFLPFKLN